MNRCVYINLAAAAERRRSLEASFASASHEGWRLERFEALGPADVARIEGSITPAEKACFASHRAAIGNDLDHDGHLFMAEDDAVFSKHALAVVDAVFDHGGDWDILFTDTVTSDLALMVRLAKRRDGLIARGHFDLVNLADRAFFCASAYVVRGGAKAHLHQLLADADRLDTPYDLFLRELCHAGKIKAGVIFPFVTTVGSASERSQIQPDLGAITPTFDAFRRLKFIERDLEASGLEIGRLQDTYCDATSRLVGGIFAAIASPAFPSDG